MLYSCSRKSYNTQNSFTLHRVLRDYQQQQNQRRTLLNKINMFKINQNKNQNRAQSLEKQLKKINKAKREYKQQKKFINRKLQQRNKIPDQKKIKIQKIKRDKENIVNAKNYIYNDRRKVYETTRQNRIQNQIKITKNKQTYYKEKRKLSVLVRQHEEQTRTKTELFYQKKLESIKKEHTKQILNLSFTNQKNQEELKKLRTLEMQMVGKFSESLTSLRSSRSKVRNSRNK